MTEENYEYRTSQMMLRNELPGDGKWSIPIIPKFQMKCGGEVVFEWGGTKYCCFGKISPSENGVPLMVICQAGSVEVNRRTEKWCETADELLEYMVGEDRLRDVITRVTVMERTI